MRVPVCLKLARRRRFMLHNRTAGVQMDVRRLTMKTRDSYVGIQRKCARLKRRLLLEGTGQLVTGGGRVA